MARKKKRRASSAANANPSKYRKMGYNTAKAGRPAIPPKNIGARNERAYYEGAGKAMWDKRSRAR